jgi:hypothetical protein
VNLNAFYYDFIVLFPHVNIFRELHNVLKNSSLPRNCQVQHKFYATTHLVSTNRRRSTPLMNGATLERRDLDKP